MTLIGTPVANPRHSDRSATIYLAFVGILIAFGIDVALPAFDDIEADLPTGGASISLIVTLYFVGMAVGQVFYGPISDRFGRRPALLVGLSFYVIGALASAFAPSFGFLLGARLLWGFGAAAAASLRMAMARDLFEGDQMARIVTIVMAVFMIGPIFVPIVGELILTVAPWPAVFLAAMTMAVGVMAWTIWFGETLPVERRRALELRPLAEATGAVFSTRVTIGHILAQTFAGAAFFSFLGSSQPVIDRIYGREEQFVYFFGSGGVLMVLALLINNRLITTYGARQMTWVTSAVLVIASTVGLVLTLGSGGTPSIWIWFGWIAVANAMSTTLAPMCSALALQPMGEQAGTAASVLGVITLAGGAGLGAIIDAAIGNTVTPMAVGYLACGLATVAALRWAGAPEN